MTTIARESLPRSGPRRPVAVSRRNGIDGATAELLVASIAEFLRIARARPATVERALNSLGPREPRAKARLALIRDQVQGRSREAKILFETALREDPSDYETWTSYAICLRRARLANSRVNAAFQEALRINPLDPRTLSGYGAFVDESLDEPDVAEPFLRKATTEPGTSGRALARYARFLWRRRRDKERALAYFQRAYAADPDDGTSVAHYAQFVTDVLRDPDHGRRLFQEGLAADPASEVVLGLYARFLRTYGGPPTAIDAVITAVRRSPQHRGGTLAATALLSETTGDLLTAEAMLRKAVREEPQNARNHANLALFLWRHRKSARAITAAFEAGLAKARVDAYLLTQFGSFTASLHRDLSGAEKLFRRAIRLDPADPFALSAYAWFLWLTGKPLRSVRLYLRRAREVEPDNPQTLMRVARVLEGTGHPWSAISHYRQAAELGGPRFGVEYGYFLWRHGYGVGQAQEILERALARAPSDPRTLSAIGHFEAAALRNTELAVSHYDTALRIDPTNETTRLRFANDLWVYCRNWERAEAAFRLTLEHEPRNAAALATYGDFLMSRADALSKPQASRAKAAKLFDRAVRLSPTDPVVLRRYAEFLYSREGNGRRASAMLKRATNLYPRSAAIALEHARLLKHRGQFDEAEAEYRRSLTLGTSGYATLSSLAGFYLQRGDVRDALDNYRAALMIEPFNPVGLMNYAGVSLALGSSDGPEILNHALARADRPVLLLEGAFYSFAHAEHEETATLALLVLNGLLDAGVRSPGWNLSPNVERARVAGVRDPSIVAALAARIASPVQGGRARAGSSRSSKMRRR